MKIPPSFYKSITIAIALFSLATAISFVFSHYKSKGTFDAVYEAGFPIKFFVTGGFFNIHHFFLVPFLVDLTLVFIVVIICSKILSKR